MPQTIAEQINNLKMMQARKIGQIRQIRYFISYFEHCLNKEQKELDIIEEDIKTF